MAMPNANANANTTAPPGKMYWVRNPHLIPARVRYWLWERRNPDKPWLCPGTVAFCERNLRPDMRGLEFGSGRSTAWFAGQLGHLTSVEHHAAWHDKVRAVLQNRRVANVDYRLVPLEHPDTEPERDHYDPMPAYVRVADEFPDASLDLVFVDGHYRTQCIRRALPKLRPGGLLLVDDTNFWPGRWPGPVPRDWERLDDRTNGLKWTSVWRKPPVPGS